MEKYYSRHKLRINPEILEDRKLSKDKEPIDILQNKKMPHICSFNGAGCGTDRMKTALSQIFQEYL